ncbi:hypothetical protein BMS3Abin07_01977 [bacterium BMS3Abin07]|nr:hypothetical protein BMS3Abin07_01977 [bacterium BMS3Abin07]GBE32422.1 hypothetical protein BMS3Bbin05_01337 [bacterium BMS3Bbin05]
MMIRRQDGFTLVELMIAMAIFVFAIAATSQIFTGLLTQFKQQTKIAETNIEGVIGLEILRRDIEMAGFGLPFDLNGATYTEAVNDPNTNQNETGYNDAGTNPPRALVSGDGQGAGNSDVLVIKATNVAINNAAERWTYVSEKNGVYTIPVWRDVNGTILSGENLRKNSSDSIHTDRVIAVQPVLGSRRRVLVSSGGIFFTQFNPSNADPPVIGSKFQPVVDSLETYMIYGVIVDVDPRMPFNRADYYVRVPLTPPARCAPGTGVLYKGVVVNKKGVSGGNLTEYPLLNCVADMQVVYRLDTTADGNIDTSTGNIAALTAKQVRDQVKEVRVFMLVHEGQRDATFRFNNFIPPPTVCATCIRVGDATGGRDFDVSGITNYLNYRWKVYTMIVDPENLREL